MRTWLLLAFMSATQAAEPDLGALHREAQACVLQVYLLPAQAEEKPADVADERARPRSPDKTSALRPFDELLRPKRRLPRSMPQHPVGLGLLWRDARHVLSTQTVLPDEADGQLVAVEDATGRRQRAERLGSDPRSGAVLLRLAQPVAGAQPCRWGSAAALQRGQALVGIGNLGELRLSVQRGHVAGLQRRLGPGFTPYIETSVPSGRGMAGGPLFDAQGRVVGVHEGIYGQGGFQLAALALPIDALLAGAEALAAGQRPQVTRIGLLMESEVATLADFLEPPPGVRVIAVEPGSAAARAGLREDDRLLTLDDEALHDRMAWAQTVAWLPPGQGVRIGLQRGAERLTLRLTPDAAP